MAPDAKYFKNIVCINNSSKTLKISMKTPAKKQEIFDALRKCIEPLQKAESTRRIDVDVEGTEER